MTLWRAFFVGCALPMLGASCGGRTESRPRAVPANVVAVVGDDFIDPAAVAHVASAQNIPPGRALDRLVADAVVAGAAAEKVGRDRVRQARRGALARMLLQTLAEEARRKGPPTDAEVNEISDKRWWELDRPPLLRTTHAVVLIKTPTDDARARAVAARIADKVNGISDPAAFRAAATAVPAEGLEVRVEDLPLMRRDGTTADLDSPQPGPRGQMVKEFADAAFAIGAAGRTSPVVRTEFGYHVILAVSWTPEHRVPLEERRSLLADEIMNARALASSNATLAHAKSIDPVTIERSAVESMMLVQTAP